MPSMAEALKKAGPELQMERAKALAIRAWQTWPRAHESGMRYNFIARALSEEMTYAMILDDDPEYIQDLINNLLQCWNPARKVQVTGAKPVGGGHNAGDTHELTAPATNSVPAQAGGGGQRDHDTQMESAPAEPSRDGARLQALRRSEPAMATVTPTTRAPAAPHNFGPYMTPPRRLTLAEMEERRQRAMDENIKTEKRLCRLDTVLVFGKKKIGDCTVEEVKEWIKVRDREGREARRDVRFAQSLIGANSKSGDIIRNLWVSADAVDELYAKAEIENAA